MNNRIPTEQQMREFLRAHYKADRFELRDTRGWGADYSQCIVRSRIEDLRRYGVSYISLHESVSGKTLKFNVDLQMLV